MPKFWRVALCIALCLFCMLGAVRAQDTPETRFNTLFDRFCQSLGTVQPSVCAKRGGEFTTKLDRRLLALESHCAGHPEALCKEFEDLLDKAPELEPLVLAYSHEAGTWNVRNRLSEDRIDKDVAGKPTVSLDRQEDFLVIVEDTNPLLYTLTAGAATEVDIPELTEMRKLAGLLGGNIGALVTSIGTQTGDDSFTTYQKKLADRLGKLQQAVAGVQVILGKVTDRTNLASHFTQQVELGKSAVFPLAPSGDLQGDLRFAVGKLAEEKGQALGDEQLCIAFLDAVGGVLAADPAKVQDIRKGALEAEGIARRQTCNSDMKDVVADLRKLLVDVLETIDNDPAQLPDFLKDESRSLLPKVRALSGLSTTYKNLVAQVDPILQKEGEARKAAVLVTQFEDRLHDFIVDSPSPCPDNASTSCVAADDVDRRLYLDKELKPVRWDKIQNHSIKLKNNAPLAATVVANRPAEIEAPYSLDSVFRDLWGIAASVVYTPLQAPTFGAVSNTSNQMVIAKTDEETRAGKIALLMNYKLGKRLCPGCGGLAEGWGLEFGSGIDADEPAFFGGLSLQLGRYVRMGLGGTYQQVKELKGQKIGDVVKAAGDIKTRDSFKADYYISLSIGFESLRLFTSGN